MHLCVFPPTSGILFKKLSLDQYSTYGNILLMQFSCVSQTRSVTPTVGLQWDDQCFTASLGCKSG